MKQNVIRPMLIFLAGVIIVLGSKVAVDAYLETWFATIMFFPFTAGLLMMIAPVATVMRSGDRKMQTVITTTSRSLRIDELRRQIREGNARALDDRRLGMEASWRALTASVAVVEQELARVLAEEAADEQRERQGLVDACQRGKQAVVPAPGGAKTQHTSPQPVSSVIPTGPPISPKRTAQRTAFQNLLQYDEFMMKPDHRVVAEYQNAVKYQLQAITEAESVPKVHMASGELRKQYNKASEDYAELIKKKYDYHRFIHEELEDML